MRILFVNRLMGIFWGGGETFDYNMSMTLSEIGHQVKILTGKPLLGKPKNKIEGLNVYYISTPFLRGVSYKLSNRIPKIPILFMLLDLYLFEKIAFKWIKEHKDEIDVVNILALPRLAKDLVEKLKIPVVLRYPGPPSLKWDISILRRIDSKEIIEIFAAGDAVQRFENFGIHINNIPQGVDSNHFKKIDNNVRKKYGISEKEILLLSCGRIIPGKGFEFLIESFKEVYEKYQNIKLIIVGDGSLRPSLEKKVVSLGIKDNVIFVGRIDHKELPKYYSSADIFLLLSSYENFSNAVLEAMSCELPVITTNIGGFPLQVKDGKNGYLVDYGDINLLVKKILYLVRNPAIREKMGKINREEILQNYRWRNSAKKLIKLYNKILNNKKKKIIFVIPNLGRGGAERVLENLLGHLDKTKFELLCIFYDSKHVLPISQGVSIYNLDLPGSSNYLKKIIYSILRIIKINSIITKEKPDIVFSFLNRVNIIVIISSYLSRIKPKIIISERNTPSKQLKNSLLDKITKIFIRLFYPKVDKIVAVSKGVKKDLVENFMIPEDKIRVIYNPVDVEKIQEMAKDAITEHSWFNERIPIVINVASLSIQKGQKYLLEAFKLVRKRMKCRLVILGEGEKENDLKQLAKNLGIANYVTFLGFQKNPFKFMARSKVFVLSSLWEGFPNVILEAVACGVPVVSTDCPSGPSEIIKNGVNGYLAAVKDIKGLSDRILELLHNDEKSKYISLNAKVSVNKFDVKNIVKEYESLFLI